MTRLLLDGQLAPLGTVVGFIEAPLARCVDPVARIFAGTRGVAPERIGRSPVPGPLRPALAELPAANGPSADRYLLMPTDGPWTAFLDNSPSGGDPRRIAGTLPDELGCRTATVYAVPGADGGFDVLGFTLAAPGHAGLLDAVRVLILEQEDGRPRVQTYGEPLPGEPDPVALSLDSLYRILRSLRIRAFDEDWYLPDRTEAVLLRAPNE
jgi:hypothetical protein